MNTLVKVEGSAPRISTLTPGLRPDTPHGIIPELDGIRGIAILLVLLVHFKPVEAVPHVVARVIALGWSGVDLFFVLSGFLITGILLETRESKHYFSNFYIRRILRILPLYLVSVLSYFHLVLPAAHHFGQLRADTNALEPWFWLHLSNWPIAFGRKVVWIGHFWSLAIEEQFYLVWPLVVFLAGRKRLPYVCVMVALCSFAARYAFRDHTFSHEFLYVLTPFRLEPLAFGSLAACIVRFDPPPAKIRPYLAVAAAAGLLLLSYVVAAGHTSDPDYPPMATFGYTAFALIYTSLVLFAYVNSGSSTWLSSLLRSPLLRSLGKYSYAIYVFHLALFVLAANTVARICNRMPEHFQFAAWILALAVGIGVSYGIALMSWNVLEKHFLRLKSRFT
jgi:peptidoglycan/LPS O-acetylase OafA/YrhL